MVGDKIITDVGECIIEKELECSSCLPYTDDDGVTKIRQKVLVRPTDRFANHTTLVRHIEVEYDGYAYEDVDNPLLEFVNAFCVDNEIDTIDRIMIEREVKRFELSSDLSIKLLEEYSDALTDSELKLYTR